MKKLAIVLMVVFAAGLFIKPVLAMPKAVPVDPVFEFNSLPEGQHVDHVFIVRNTGDTPLNITSVLPP